MQINLRSLVAASSLVLVNIIGCKMDIIIFDKKYRDDMIFMVLQAKDALGRIPGLNEDLLDVESNYLDKGDMFWLAIDKGRVIGCIGYSRISNSSEAYIHRLFVKSTEKHRGIGTMLLNTAENKLKSVGVARVNVHLGEPREQWFESYNFYPKNGYKEYKLGYMAKLL